MPTPTGQVRNSSRERSSNGNSKEDSVEATDSGQNNNQEEQETQEYNSSSEEESEYDEEEDEKKRMEYLEDMNCLEKYFSDLKEMLYHERMRDLELKQQSVFNETAPEYLEQLQELEKSLEQNHNAALTKRDHARQAVQLRYEEEERSARKQFSEDCKLVLLKTRAVIEERMRRLHEEKVLAELSADSTVRKRKVQEFPEPPKRRKPANISGPYVVYMLKDIDIHDDMEAIKQERAKFIVKQRYYKKQYSTSDTCEVSAHKELEPNRVLLDDGEICCNGQCFCLESSVLVERANNNEAFTCVIKAINSHEVTVVRTGGKKSLILVQDIERGFFTLKPPLTSFPNTGT
jgi:breast cancer metastasis-suppressor 1-like protein